jgi:hypothetical protein
MHGQKKNLDGRNDAVFAWESKQFRLLLVFIFISTR